MEKVVWTGIVYPGKMKEYRERHDRIWPEMCRALQRAGVRNYTIWSDGERLIGYYECENREQTEARKIADPVFGEWKESMEGIMCLETKQGDLPFRRIFSLEDISIEEELIVKNGIRKGEGNDEEDISSNFKPGAVVWIDGVQFERTDK